MERRVFIAIILSFLVLYAYQALFVRATPPSTAAKPAAAGAAQTPAPTPAESALTPSNGQPAAAVLPATPEPQALVSEPSEREITVDTATVQAVLTNRGGRLAHWRLKDYRDPQGHPVDLVPVGLPPTEQLPFALRVDEEPAGTRLNNAIYRVIGDSGGHVDATRAPATVSFEYQDAAGVHVRKDFRFDPLHYIVAFSPSATNGERSMNPTVVWGPRLGDR